MGSYSTNEIKRNIVSRDVYRAGTRSFSTNEIRQDIFVQWPLTQNDPVALSQFYEIFEDLE